MIFLRSYFTPGILRNQENSRPGKGKWHDARPELLSHANTLFADLDAFAHWVEDVVGALPKIVTKRRPASADFPTENVIPVFTFSYS